MFRHIRAVTPVGQDKIPPTAEALGTGLHFSGQAGKAKSSFCKVGLSELPPSHRSASPNLKQAPSITVVMIVFAMTLTVMVATAVILVVVFMVEETAAAVILMRMPVPTIISVITVMRVSIIVRLVARIPVLITPLIIGTP